jgi:hypothetical protein
MTEPDFPYSRKPNKPKNRAPPPPTPLELLRIFCFVVIFWCCLAVESFFMGRLCCRYVSLKTCYGNER